MILVGLGGLKGCSTAYQLLFLSARGILIALEAVAGKTHLVGPRCLMRTLGHLLVGFREGSVLFEPTHNEYC